ncbi:choice-of-anchor V domain-containing protein [Aliidiomarina maris]|uniref:Reelin domain-containing protein n=1 Tax=Aliidiomarina maris TaxID=531312 RepID=A0A327X340_9GAMM|nr:choice-of-anchor V domain-containing protein [Aliidiomarina maris]RAJ99052.1 hypothetical protein B0I24_10344 [Aliidiomarina maris]RUO27784.1 hypothetical protein CWE07_04025 [Aliidiomarina maris]
MLNVKPKARVALGLAIFYLAAALPALAFPEGAEPKLTGGQGFDDCSSCHFAGPDKRETSGIELHGLAEQMVPGAWYQLTLEVTDPEQQVGGFQLAFRDLATGESVGEFDMGDGQLILPHDNVNFLGHSKPQRAEQVDGDKVTRWQFVWRAGDAESLELSVAAVAADGDDSSLGDNVYTYSRVWGAD